jgi:hypothetical protein
MQAEMKGIEECVTESLRRNFVGEVLILTDSQAAIKALRKNVISSKTTLDCMNKINLAKGKFTVKVAWVPGHSGVVGNETADELANNGIDFPTINRVVPTAETLLERQIENFTRKLAIDEWHNSDKMEHAKKHISGYDPKLATKIINLNRKDLRYVTGVLTGHACHNRFLFAINKSIYETCRFCHEEDETMYHVINECPALISARRQIFYKEITDSNDISKANYGTILRFIRRAEIQKIFDVLN